MNIRNVLLLVATLADLSLDAVVSDNFIPQLDAIAIGIGENVFPTEVTPVP